VGVDTAKGGPYVVFETLWHGWRAAAVQLLNYEKRHGLNTVQGLVSRWAPSSENDTAAYIAGVCRTLNVLPGDALNVRERLGDLVRAFAIQEGGDWPEYDMSRIGAVTAARAAV
jgi:hypothetical protein